MLEVAAHLRNRGAPRPWPLRLLGPTPSTVWAAEGELSTGRALDRLDDRWACLHSVPVGRNGSDIDHVVIGPPGVFTINSKHHPRRRVAVDEYAVTVGAVRTDYLQRARAEAERAERLLSRSCGQRITVAPLVVVYCREFRIVRSPLDVHVVAGNQLTSWLGRLRPTLDEATAADVYAHARWASTWRS